MHPSFVPYRVAGAYVAKRIQDAGMESPEVGVICGSGLSELSEALEGVTLTVSRQYIGPTLRFASQTT
jgi:purine nucleoside phosphorylase